eukprot:463271-Rhodomonas_salina.1
MLATEAPIWIRGPSLPIGSPLSARKRSGQTASGIGDIIRRRCFRLLQGSGFPESEAQSVGRLRPEDGEAERNVGDEEVGERVEPVRLVHDAVQDGDHVRDAAARRSCTRTRAHAHT